MGFNIISVLTLLGLFIGVICLIGIARCTISYTRRRLSDPLELYQFQDRTCNRPMNQAWHLVGERQLIEVFISSIELKRWVRVSWVIGEHEYVGTYKKRFVRRFRRELRERGAKLNVHYEKPELFASEYKEYHFGGISGGRFGSGSK